jgi:apolipoprotein N-acyltransferase
LSVAVTATRWAGLDRLADTVAALTGWRRYAVAALCGCLATLALPPLYLFPALLPAFCGLFWLAQGARTARQAFATGWCFGFTHFVTGLYWITNALLVDAEKFGWLAPFAVSGLSLGFAIFPGLAILVCYFGRVRGWAVGAASPVLFAVAWTAVEWLRGNILTGFPWNLMATTWSFSPTMSQPVALFGAYGLSFVTVLAAVAPAALFGSTAATRRPITAVLAMVSLLIVGALGGAVRMALAPAEGAQPMVSGVRLRLVQANIDQRLKWEESERVNTLRKYLALSTQPSAAPITDVVWPETALPYFLSTEPELLRILAQVVPPGGLLLTGAVRVDPPEIFPAQVWNSVHAIDDRGQVVATYDKFHLVPFGEYVPLRNILPIEKITPGTSDFASGPGTRTLALPGLPPVSPLVCYEAIFPGAVTARAGQRPQWLLNVTNDAWFGQSAGPHQHFASARLRAIEEGLPLVRAANTGISAVIDPYGRVLASLALGREGVLDAALPQALPPTPFARVGNWVLLVLLAAAIGAMAILRRRGAP